MTRENDDIITYVNILPIPFVLALSKCKIKEGLESLSFLVDFAQT